MRISAVEAPHRGGEADEHDSREALSRGLHDAAEPSHWPPRGEGGRRGSRGGGSPAPHRRRRAPPPAAARRCSSTPSRACRPGRRHGEQVAAARLGQARALDQDVAGLAVLAADVVGAAPAPRRRGSRAARCSGRRRAAGAGCRTCRRRPPRRSGRALARLTTPTR